MQRTTAARALMLAALMSVVLDLALARTLAAATVLLIWPTCVWAHLNSRILDEVYVPPVMGTDDAQYSWALDQAGTHF